MRLLECCSPAWPADDLQTQILSLRQAFSADVNKPFELKASFPYGSPGPHLVHTPSPAEVPYERPRITSHPSQDQTTFHSTPITPPISAGHDDPKDGSMAATSLTMLAAGRSASMPGSQMGEEGNAWNPSRLFEYAGKSLTDDSIVGIKNANVPRSQWNTAFGTPPPSNISGAAGSVPQPPYSPTASTVSHDFPPSNEQLQQQQYSVTSNMSPAPQIQAQRNTYSPPTSNPNPYVTPTMWQDTVANTYVANDLKRRWDGAGGPAWVGANDQQQVKRPC